MFASGGRHHRLLRASTRTSYVHGGSSAGPTAACIAGSAKLVRKAPSSTVAVPVMCGMGSGPPRSAPFLTSKSPFNSITYSPLENAVTFAAVSENA